MGQRGGGHRFMLGAVRHSAVVLFPGHLASVGAKVLTADMVVLAHLGPAQAGEVGFRPIGASAVLAECHGMVDPLHLEIGV